MTPTPTICASVALRHRPPALRPAHGHRRAPARWRTTATFLASSRELEQQLTSQPEAEHDQGWNYAIKVAKIERAIAFYTGALGAEVRLRGEVLGCAYALIRLGDTRLILFEKAPYEDRPGTPLPLGFLHDVYEVDDFDARIARLRGTGVRFLMEPQVIEAEFGKRRIGFFETPDGMRTEVMQILEDALGE